jgi:catechol 2,3-dioxygenase-like lactoylglutathione lyase family enzyme
MATQPGGVTRACPGANGGGLRHADRAKRFYASLGWREDADFVISEDYRVLQFTPPGSPASIIFGAEHHDRFEKAAPAHDWWDWYAPYLSARRHGSTPEQADAAADRYMRQARGVLASR